MHSDLVSSWSRKYVDALKNVGLRGSMGRVGAWSNDSAMKLFSRFVQKSFLDRKRWKAREELRPVVVVWIEKTYHRRRQQRRQRGPRQTRPVQFETIYSAAPAAREPPIPSVNLNVASTREAPGGLWGTWATPQTMNRGMDVAAIYGFRIFVIETYPNSKKGKDPLDLVCDGQIRDHMLKLLDDLAAKGTVFFPPVPPQPGHPPKPTPSVTVSEPTVVRQDLIHVRVSMGELDAHRKAASPSGPEVPLEGHSAETDHHVTFLFPTEEDAPAALLISQTYRRRDPVTRLLAMMQRRSMELRSLAQQEEKEFRAKVREEGGTPPPKQTHYKVVFDRRQATDSNYLDEIIEGAKRARAVFQAHVPSDRGAGERVQKAMSVELHLEDERALGQRISRRWAGRTRRGEATTRAEGRDELAEALHEQGLIDEDEEESYDSAQISLTGGPEGTATIAVDTMRDVFTYQVSNGQPPVFYFYEKVAPRVEAIAAEEGIEVDLIDPSEVDECLDGST